MKKIVIDLMTRMEGRLCIEVLVDGEVVKECNSSGTLFRIFELILNRGDPRDAQRFGVPVLLGLVLLKSPNMARFMNENVAGVSVPDAIIKEMDVEKKDRKKKCSEITVRLIREMKHLCQGIHFMPLGWESLVLEIIREADLAN